MKTLFIALFLSTGLGITAPALDYDFYGCPENSTEVTLSCGTTGCLSVRDNGSGEMRKPTKKELESIAPQLESGYCK